MDQLAMDQLEIKTRILTANSLRKPVASASGFSLIELMIVVAIIGVLSTIAMPNYNAVVAKARQVEAKSALSAIFTAEKSYYAENSTYTYCLYQAGYLPEGSRRFYLTGYLTTSMIPNTGTDLQSGTACFFGLIAWSGSERNDGRFDMNSWANPTLTGAVPAGLFSVPTNDTFNAVATGSISATPIFDVWQITQDRVVTNLQSGF